MTPREIPSNCGNLHNSAVYIKCFPMQDSSHPIEPDPGGLGKIGALMAKDIRHAIVLAAFLIVLVPLSSAQDWAAKRFDFRADEVYQSAVRVIGLHHEIMSKDPENRVIRFHVGTTAWSWGYNMGLLVESRPDGTSIAKAAVEKSGGPVFSWGSGKKEVSKIFRWMEEDLQASKHADHAPVRQPE